MTAARRKQSSKCVRCVLHTSERVDLEGVHNLELPIIANHCWSREGSAQVPGDMVSLHEC